VTGSYKKMKSNERVYVKGVSHLLPYKVVKINIKNHEKRNVLIT